MAWQLIEELTGGLFPPPYYHYLGALLFLVLVAVRLISSHRFLYVHAHSRRPISSHRFVYVHAYSPIDQYFPGSNRRRFLSIYMEAAAVLLHPIELFGAAVDGANGSLTGYYWFLGAFLVFVLVEVWFSFPVDGSTWRLMFRFFFIVWALIDFFFRDIESLPTGYYSYLCGYLFFVVGCLLQSVERESFGGQPSRSTTPSLISITDGCYLLSFSFICRPLVFLLCHSSPTDYYLLGAFLFIFLGVHFLLPEVRFADDGAAFDPEAGLTMGDRWMFGRRALDSFLQLIHRRNGAAGIASPDVEGRSMTRFLHICCALIVVVFGPIIDPMDRFEYSTDYYYLYLLASLLFFVGLSLFLRKVCRAYGHVLHVTNDQLGMPARERRRMRVLYGFILTCRIIEVVPFGPNGGGRAASTNHFFLGGFLLFPVGIWIMLLNVN